LYQTHSRKHKQLQNIPSSVSFERCNGILDAMTLLLAPGLTGSLLLPLCHKYIKLGAITLAAIVSNTFTKAQPVAEHSKRWFSCKLQWHFGCHDHPPCTRFDRITSAGIVSQIYKVGSYNFGSNYIKHIHESTSSCRTFQALVLNIDAMAFWMP
jgi:hypothetical protein